MDQAGPYSSDGLAPARDLRQRLAQAADAGTPAERCIAGLLSANLQALPFETAATVALKTGVSEATVGRFCHSISYWHLKDPKVSLQTDLEARAKLICDRLPDFHRRRALSPKSFPGFIS